MVSFCAGAVRSAKVTAVAPARRVPAAFVVLAFGALVAGCSNPGQTDKLVSRVDPLYGVPASPRVVEMGEPIPRGGGVRRLGRPYTVAGRTFVPAEQPDYRNEGIASWYGHAFHGRRTANGEIYDMQAFSAAHRTLPLPSYVRVTNIANNRSMVVRVNDRGPFHGDRIIDLSIRTAQVLGFQDNGLARVRVEYVGPASLEGSDDRMLLATLRNESSPGTVRLASASPMVPQAPAASPLLDRPGVTPPMPTPRPFDLGTYSVHGQRVTEAAPVATGTGRQAPLAFAAETRTVR